MPKGQNVVPDVDLNELERYLRIYQENPDSRVFAPLADMYRRLARYREAEQICREGLQRHPYYAGGKVALAYILFDTGRLPEAYQEINSVVTYYPDNLMARKIMVRVLGMMGDTAKARREYEALQQLAPQLAGDPELERALKGPGPAAAENMGFGGFSPAPRVSHPAEKTEAEWGNSPKTPAPKGRRLSSRREFLTKKKRVLEHWLRALEQTPN
ncbi:MAG: tetratricopeptide repeat protein [Bdellovibrionota bacterium]